MKRTPTPNGSDLSPDPAGWRWSAARRAGAGFTLVELLVTISIAAIVAVLAIPNYNGFVTRTARSQARALLVQVADRQEQFFLDNKRYSGDLTELGFAADPLYIDSDRRAVAAESDAQIYRIEFQASAATSFTVAAVPQLHQADSDTACGTLSLTHTGMRSQSGVATDCW